MLVRVGSSLRILFSISINISDFLHKIIVAVEEFTLFDKTEVASVVPKMNRQEIPILKSQT